VIDIVFKKKKKLKSQPLLTKIVKEIVPTYKSGMIFSFNFFSTVYALICWEPVVQISHWFSLKNDLRKQQDIYDQKRKRTSLSVILCKHEIKAL